MINTLQILQATAEYVLERVLSYVNTPLAVCEDPIIHQPLYLWGAYIIGYSI